MTGRDNQSIQNEKKTPKKKDKVGPGSYLVEKSKDYLLSKPTNALWTGFGVKYGEAHQIKFEEKLKIKSKRVFDIIASKAAKTPSSVHYKTAAEGKDKISKGPRSMRVTRH